MYYSLAEVHARTKDVELTSGDIVAEIRYWRVEIPDPNELYMRTVCCADVYANEAIGQRPDGTTIYAPIEVPRFGGKRIEPGDQLLIDPVRTPQTGDWVHVGEGVAWGISGIGGHRFKEYTPTCRKRLGDPGQEYVLGVIVDHFPAVQGGQTGWSTSLVLANGEDIPIDRVYVCSYNDSRAFSAADDAARKLAAELAIGGVKVSKLVTTMTPIEGKNVVFFPGPCEQQ